MRLPNGTLVKIHKITGISTPNLSEYISNKRFPSRNRAIVLGNACAKLGFNVPKETWMFGTTEEIKSALITCNQKSEDSTTKKQMEIF
ncbi:MAG: hypothetical protein GY714_12365 [Desulfobacterales bacterium]|nr:hypothetical protein [Desulfobacterales bacterium]